MTIKNIIFTLLLNIILSTNLCNAQDRTKAFLFLSVFCEESDSYYELAADIVKRFDSMYEQFSFECTNPLVIPVDTLHSGSLESYKKYIIQLFKLKTSLTPSYYILRLSPCNTYKFSFPEELWIRISGYRESDLKIFFDTLRKQGLGKREIIEMVNQWRNADELFCELDWDCLLKGYFKNKTCYSCYVSGANIRYKARYLGEKDDIYAVFSKKTLAGSLFIFE